MRMVLAGVLCLVVMSSCAVETGLSFDARIGGGEEVGVASVSVASERHTSAVVSADSDEATTVLVGQGVRLKYAVLSVLAGARMRDDRTNACMQVLSSTAVEDKGELVAGCDVEWRNRPVVTSVVFGWRVGF